MNPRPKTDFSKSKSINISSSSSNCSSSITCVSGYEKLKWIHLRYHPPGLILQCQNLRTLKESQKVIELLDFSPYSSLDETARYLIREETLFQPSIKTTLMECLQKLKLRNRLDSKKQFQIIRSVRSHSLPILAAAFSRDGAKFATSSFDKTCRVWDSYNGKLLCRLAGHFDAVSKCIFNVKADRILTGSYDGTLRLWPTISIGKKTPNPYHVFLGAQGEIEAIDISDDGLWAAAGSTDKIARVFDLTNGSTLFSFDGHSGNVSNVAFDRNSCILLSGCSDGRLGLWDLNSGQLIQWLSGHEAEVMKCSFNFLGSQIVSCSIDKLVNVWDLRNTEKPLMILTENTDEVWDVKFNSRCRLLASGAKDGRLLIWDIRNGTVVTNKVAHDNPIHEINFNAAGSLLLTCSEEKVARLWNANSGELSQVLAGHSDKVIHGSFNYLGNRILTVSSDTISRIWE